MARKLKDSGIEWIGQIPKEWSVGRVKNGFYRKKEEAHQDNPVILSLARSGVKIRDISSNEGQLAKSYYNYNVVNEGDFLINPMDLYSGANCSISKVSGVISPAYINLGAKPGYISEYYDYYFKTQYWAMSLFAHGKGVSFDNRWTLGAEDLLGYYIPIPPTSEQKRISSFLASECSRIDDVIEKTQASIEEYKKLKQAIITQAVTKGIRPYRDMKDSGFEWIGKMPKEWECTLLKRHCGFLTGSTPSTTNKQWFNGDLDWFTPADFNDNYYLKNSTRNLSMLAKEDGVATIIPPNTVMIIGIGGTAGKVGYTTNECSCNQQITAITTDDKLHSKYLMYWMIANTKRLKETALFTTLPIINNQTIGQYHVLVPNTIEEQVEIAEYLDFKVVEIEKLIGKKEYLLDIIEGYKKALIFEYVTGKREVTNADYSS